MAKVRLRALDEGLDVRNDPARVIVELDDVPVMEVVAYIGRLKGADGGWYQCVRFGEVVVLAGEEVERIGKGASPPNPLDEVNKSPLQAELYDKFVKRLTQPTPTTEIVPAAKPSGQCKASRGPNVHCYHHAGHNSVHSYEEVCGQPIGVSVGSNCVLVKGHREDCLGRQPYRGAISIPCPFCRDGDRELLYHNHEWAGLRDRRKGK